GQTEQVMQGHHRLMNKFLETHRNIMLASLQPQAVGVVGVPSATSCAAPAQAAALAQAAPIPMAVPPTPAPAAAPVPVVMAAAASVADAAPASAPVASATPAAARVTREDIAKVLLELVSQRTGYPVDSLDIDLDLEGDLGVDSIKRVEIFSALQSES